MNRKEFYNSSYLDKQGPSLDEHTIAIGRMIAEELIRVYNPAMVLDCGCGYGWLTYQLNAYGVNCYGIDINQSAIDWGKQNYQGIDDKLICLDLCDEAIPFCDSFFDLVVARELLEHFPDEYLFRVIAEIVRVTGKFFQMSSPMIIPGIEKKTVDEYLQWKVWLKSCNSYTFEENLALIDSHPDLKSIEVTPSNGEHPNAHRREYWIQLFQLIGFKHIMLEGFDYSPVRVDESCGLCILDFETGSQ